MKLLIVAICLWAYKGNLTNVQAMDREKFTPGDSGGTNSSKRRGAVLQNSPPEHSKDRIGSLNIRENVNAQSISPPSIIMRLGKKDKANVDEIKAAANPDDTIKKKKPHDQTLGQSQGIIKVKKMDEELFPSPTNTSETPGINTMTPLMESALMESASIRPPFSWLPVDSAVKAPKERYHTLEKKVSRPQKNDVNITVPNPVYNLGKSEDPELEEWEKKSSGH